MTRASKPAACVPAWASVRSGGPQVRRRLDADDRRTGGQRHLHVGRDEGHPGTAIERGLGDGDAHLAGGAIADEADRIDRLARPAGGHHDVPTLEVGVVGGRDERRPSRRIRGPDRPIGDGRDDRVHDRRRARPVGRRRTDPTRAARRPGARSGSRSRRAAARRSRGSPGGSTCRRPSPARRRAARSVARQVAVTTSPASPLAIAPSQCAVAGATTMASAVSARTMCPIRPSGSRSSRSVSTGWRDSAAKVSGPDEPGRGRGQHHRHVGAFRAQGPEQLDRLVGRDRAGDTESDQTALEPTAALAGRHAIPRSSGTPPETSA